MHNFLSTSSPSILQQARNLKKMGSERFRWLVRSGESPFSIPNISSSVLLLLSLGSLRPKKASVFFFLTHTWGFVGAGVDRSKEGRKIGSISHQRPITKGANRSLGLKGQIERNRGTSKIIKIGVKVIHQGLNAIMTMRFQSKEGEDEKDR